MNCVKNARLDYLLGELRKAGTKAEAMGWLARGVMYVTVKTGVSVTFWFDCSSEVYKDHGLPQRVW